MPEPSMQEIIASISRLIAQDSHPPHPLRASASEDRAILELTDIIEADGTIRKISGEKLAEDINSGAEPEARAADDGNAATAAKAGDAGATLLSTAAAEAAVAAFGELGSAAAEQDGGRRPLLGPACCNLKEVVREAVRPLLRAWLNDHLPAIVEGLVQEEIQRLVSEARPQSPK